MSALFFYDVYAFQTFVQNSHTYFIRKDNVNRRYLTHRKKQLSNSKEIVILDLSRWKLSFILQECFDIVTCRGRRAVTVLNNFNPSLVVYTDCQNLSPLKRRKKANCSLNPVYRKRELSLKISTGYF